MAETVRKTTRIHVALNNQKLPVVFSYHQLFKLEQKQEPIVDTSVPLDASSDNFYENLLKRAENYVPSDEDDGSDDENLPTGKKLEDYDFADPFIDDSEMLMEEPEDYTLPEFDGFFVYQGPLDGSEGNTTTDKKQQSTSKSKSNAKGKEKGISASNNKKQTEKSSRTSKKTSSDESTTKAKKSTSSSSSGAGGAGSKISSQSSDPSTPASNSNNKKATTATSATNESSKKGSTSSTTTATSSTSKKKSSSSSTTNGDNSKEEGSSSTNGNIPPIRVDLTSDSDTVSADKKKADVELLPLDDDVKELINILRRDVREDMFENKSKFPNALKPTVFQLGVLMLKKYRNIDDNVIAHLMTILPYNRFTLRKLLTTKSGQIRIDELQQEIDEMAIQLKLKIDSMMPEQTIAYNEKVAQAQQEKQQQQQANGDSSDAKNNAEEEEEEVVEKKFRCNDEVRKLLYEIMKADEQSVTISNLIAAITKKPEIGISEGKARKMMYQRLLSCWPEGWMNSYEMSRQYSQYKAKVTPTKNKAAAAAAAATVPSSSPSSQTSKAAGSGTATTASTPPDRKRKRATPQTSPDDAARKKVLVSSSSDNNILPSPLKLNQTQPTIIDLDNDDDDGDDDKPQQPWQQQQQQQQQQQPSSSSASSMKIEALISGPKN